MNLFKFLVPRFALLAVLAMGIWASSGLMTRSVLNQTRVFSPLDLTVDQADLGWQNSELTVRNFLLGRDGVGSFQADKLSLKLDQDALTQQRWVVIDGILTNPSVVAPAGSTLPENARRSPGLADRLSEALRVAHQRGDYNARPKLAIEPTWWQQVQSAQQRTASPGQHTRQALETWQTKWAGELAACRQQTAEFRQQLEAAAELAKRPNNPLRQDSRLTVTQQINQISGQIVDVQSRIERIQQAAADELAAISTTIESEVQGLESALRLPLPPATNFDQDLLTQHPPQPLEQVFLWAEWAQAVVPNLTDDAISSRGRDVHFGRQPLPSLEVQKLTLAGVTSVGNRYYRLMGSLNNLTNRPFAQREPASLSLRAQGDHHVMVSGRYDQRHGQQKAFFSVRSLDLARDQGLSLVSAQDRVGLPIQVSPSRYTAQLQLNLDGQQVDGQLVVRHSQTHIDCDLSHVQNETLAARLQQELQAIDSFVITYRLSGTTDRIVATGHCDLGLQIARALGSTTQDHFESLVEKQAASLTQAIASQQRQLGQWVQSETQQLMAAVKQELAQVASLQGNLDNDASLRLR